MVRAQSLTVDHRICRVSWTGPERKILSSQHHSKLEKSASHFHWHPFYHIDNMGNYSYPAPYTRTHTKAQGLPWHYYLVLISNTLFICFLAIKKEYG